MVRFSKRKALLRRYEKEWKERAESAIARWMLDIDNPIEDAVDMYFAECVNEVNQRRYLFRSLKNRRRHGKIPEFLKEMGVWDSRENLGAEDEDDSSGHDSRALSSCTINDNDFLREFRVSRKSFKALHDLIKDHPVFNRGRRGPKQEPSEFQLLIFLRFVGQCGDGNSSHRMKLFFPASVGGIDNAKKRVLQAVLALRNIAIVWPDEEERKEIARRMHAKFDWPNLVFIADGTLFPFATKPQLEDAADYKGRKLGYTLNAMILCDDRRRVRAYLAGNPGTCHDERALKQMQIANHPEDFLSDREYGIGDSAFDPRRWMVPAYKKPARHPMPREHEVLNEKMKKPRVISEHVNGILKNRFRILNKLPFVVKDKATMRETIKYIDACIILHNLLVGIRDDVPDEWLHEIERLSDIDECEPLEDDDELNQPVLENRRADTRRNQLMHYFNEKTAVFY
jgi:hypothetical protein